MAGEKMRARMLLVEEDTWDAGLIQEAVDELEERPHQNLLGRPIDLFHAATLDEALAAAGAESYDIILLDLAWGGGSRLQPYLRMRETAPSVPIVVLAKRDEEILALTAMREGAAGYLLKDDIDCIPLARALRSACERQQALAARSELPGTDDLTGLNSRAGFLYLGDMALRLSARWKKPARVSLVTLTGYSRMQDVFGGQARDLALLETSEMMRALFADADLIARTGAEQFAALTIGGGGEVRADSPRLRERAAEWVARRMGDIAAKPALAYDASEWIIDPATESLSDVLRAPLRQAAAGMPK